MIDPVEQPAPHPTSAQALDPGHLFHRWFVEYNPIYLASAALVLGGLTMLSIDLATAENGAQALAGISELYALALVFGVFVLRRLGQRRVAVMLALLVMVWQCDLTMFTESSAFRPELGVAAALLWATLFALKLRLLALALELTLGASSYAVACFGALGVAALPQLFRTSSIDPATLVALFVFVLGAAALYLPRTLRSAVGFDIRGRRAVAGGWAILAAGLAFHVADWHAELGVSLGALLFVGFLLALRFARSGVACTVLVLLSLVVVVSIHLSPHLVFGLLTSALVLRALRGPVRASDARGIATASPYRGVEGTEAAPLPLELAQSFGAVDSTLREQLLLGAWSFFCLDLAFVHPGWVTLAIFVLGCLLAFAIGRRTQALAPIAPPLVVIALLRGWLTHSIGTWGALAVTLGFAALLGGLLVTWRRSRIPTPTTAPS